MEPAHIPGGHQRSELGLGDAFDPAATRPATATATATATGGGAGGGGAGGIVDWGGGGGFGDWKGGGALGGGWRGGERCVGWGVVACSAPAHSAGVVSVEVSGESGGFSHGGAEFQFVVEAAVAGVQPGSGPESGGGVVSLQGAHLGESGLLCRFGSAAPGAAQFVSTAVARCEAAAHAEGAVALEVSLGDGGQQYSRSGAVYEYVAEAEVGGVEPAEYN